MIVVNEREEHEETKEHFLTIFDTERMEDYAALSLATIILIMVVILH